MTMAKDNLGKTITTRNSIKNVSTEETSSQALVDNSAKAGRIKNPRHRNLNQSKQRGESSASGNADSTANASRAPPQHKPDNTIAKESSATLPSGIRPRSSSLQNGGRGKPFSPRSSSSQIPLPKPTTKVNSVSFFKTPSNQNPLANSYK